MMLTQHPSESTFGHNENTSRWILTKSMSDDQNSKSGGWLGNPLPIVMVVLLAGGLLVKNVPLESARPTDPERVKFVATSQQDVEARLWQDPFAAV